MRLSRTPQLPGERSQKRPGCLQSSAGRASQCIARTARSRVFGKDKKKDLEREVTKSALKSKTSNHRKHDKTSFLSSSFRLPHPYYLEVYTTVTRSSQSHTKSKRVFNWLRLIPVYDADYVIRSQASSSMPASDSCPPTAETFPADTAGLFCTFF